MCVTVANLPPNSAGDFAGPDDPDDVTPSFVEYETMVIVSALARVAAVDRGAEAAAGRTGASWCTSPMFSSSQGGQKRRREEFVREGESSSAPAGDLMITLFLLAYHLPLIHVFVYLLQQQRRSPLPPQKEQSMVGEDDTEGSGNAPGGNGRPR